MGLDYGTAYSPTGTDETDANYPAGKGVNATSQTAKDGFPAKANRSNDLLGFLQWIKKTAARGRITDRTTYLADISGSPDNANASDYGDGLLELMNPIDPAISAYSSATDYVFGNLVKLYGRQYLCLVANGPASTVQNPLTDVNGDYWFKLPGEDWCRGMSQVIMPFYLGVKPIFDYNDGSYQMVFPFGQYKLGTTIFKYFAVIHDSSNVISSGNAAYAAMGQGTKGAAIATFSAGDYTMFDGKDCAISAQGPNRPASFGRQEDAMQKITGTYDIRSVSGGGDIQDSLTGPFSLNGGAGVNRAGLQSGTNSNGDILTFDSSNSLLPNPAKTNDLESRMKNLQGGPLAQIVCEVI